MLLASNLCGLGSHSPYSECWTTWSTSIGSENSERALVSSKLAAFRRCNARASWPTRGGGHLITPFGQLTMRLREFLFGTALMSIALVTTKASAPAVLGNECKPDFAADARSVVEARTSVPTPSAPSPLISRDKVFGSAYYDTLSILRSNNPCSVFLVGPLQSTFLTNSSAGSGRTLSQWASPCACQD